MAQEIQYKTEFLFTNQVIGNEAFMRLNQQIGPDASGDPYIDGAKFSDEMYRNKAAGRKNIVKINSPGGRVLHGWNIVDSIIETGADTFNTGVAYSMAGICLLFGKHRKSYDYAGMMIHAPRNTSGENTPSVEFAKGQFKTLLETRTKLSKAEIDNIIDGGKDHFYTAQEAFEKGLIDEVVPSGRLITPPLNASAKDLCAFYNSQDQNQNNDMDFKEILNSLTGKKNESESIVAVTQMKGEIESLTASVAAKDQELTALKAKVTELENAGKANDVKAKATKLIEDAEKAYKLVGLKSEDKAKLIENAIANFEGAELMIKSMPSKKEFAAAGAIKDEKGDTMTYEHLAKHDPKQLAQIAENDPELFARLADEYNESKKAK